MTNITPLTLAEYYRVGLEAARDDIRDFMASSELDYWADRFDREASASFHDRQVSVRYYLNTAEVVGAWG